jgi:hypothetical protein
MVSEIPVLTPESSESDSESVVAASPGHVTVPSEAHEGSPESDRGNDSTSEKADSIDLVMSEWALGY